MPKRKIEVGDFFTVHDMSPVFRCCSVDDRGGIRSSYDGEVFSASECERLPASPKQLVKLWKLEEKILISLKKGTCGKTRDYLDAIKSLINKSKRTQRKRK